MNIRRWPAAVLALLLGLPAVSTLRGQTIRLFEPKTPTAGSRLKAIGVPLHNAGKGERPSHRPINTGLDENLQPEDVLAQRLMDARLRKSLQDNKDFQDQLKGLAGKFLRDPDLLKSLAGKIDPEAIERLKKSIGEGDAFGNDPALKDLFEEGKNLYEKGKLGKRLSGDEKDLLKRFGEKLQEQRGGMKPPFGPSTENPPGNPPRVPESVSGPKPDQGPAPEPPAWERLQEKSSDWLKGNVDGWVKNLDQWADSPSGKSWRDTFAEWAKKAAEGQARAPNLAERARGFTRYLPRPSDYLPKNILPRTPEPRLPTLPRINVPGSARMPGVPSASSVPSGKVVVWLIVLGLLAVVLWRGGWWQRLREAQARGWKLGPWPVRPGEVATRADLVRAFEHLALLNLGPIARTRHHLDLGGLLGAQADLDPDRRREAAGTLARLYEQARYTPDDEALPPELMASARRELAYLAGVSQA
jgi:hypothetical protein